MSARAPLFFGPRLIPLLLVMCAVTVPSYAQGGCTDPTPFGQVNAARDNLVTFSDGYKTRMDVYFPFMNPGSCGWPTVLFIHSNRSSRQGIAEEAEALATAGYCTIAFDLRGQGPSMAMNSPAIYGRGALGIRERLDMFEILEAAEAQFDWRIDFDRLGVTGPTQGGHYGWAAAAHSGLTLPPNPWRSTPLPVITAVAVHDFDIDAWEWLVPGGTNVSEMFVFNVLQDSASLAVDPAFRAAAMPLVLAEDYAALRALVDPPELHIPTLLRTSAVPILATLSYDDMFGAATSTVEEWPHIVPGADKVLNLTTSGHQSPVNERERALRTYREKLWFDDHLKGIGDYSESMVEHRYAVVPGDVSDCLDPNTLWDTWEDDAAPESLAVSKRFYFGDSGSLHPSPGSVGQGTDVLDSVNLTGYGIDDYINEAPTPEELMTEIPLEALSYTGAVLTEDEQMVGSAVVHLPLYSDDADLMVHVALMDVAPNGTERYITGGFRTVRDHPGGALVLEFPLAVYGYRLVEGHRMRVRVENHAWHRPPMKPGIGGVSPTFLRGLPVFSDYSVDVLRGSGNKPWIELPIVSPPPVRLSVSTPSVSGNNPQDVQLMVYSDSRYAGWRYQIFPCFAGTGGSTLWKGYSIPLVFDGLTRAVLGISTGIIDPEMRGFLNSEGTSESELDLGMLNSLPASAVGVSLVVLAGVPGGPIEFSDTITLPIH